jgi:Fanconi anemia group M protein
MGDLQEFRSGGFNTLVSTSIGEEGLDIGDVDLIVSFDVPKSPISLVQRMVRSTVAEAEGMNNV